MGLIGVAALSGTNKVKASQREMLSEWNKRGA